METKKIKLQVPFWLVMALLSSTTLAGVALAHTAAVTAPVPAGTDTEGFPTALPDGYQIGDMVANFRLKSVDGRMISLSDFGGQKGVIVVFMSNHCPFSRAYEDRITALDRKYSSLGYPVLAVNPSDPVAYPDDTFDQMQERARSKAYSFPFLADDRQGVAQAFGASRTPHVFVLKNNGGKFTVQYMGTLDDNPQDPSGVTKRYVDDAVSNLLANKPVVITSTKAIGCAIKWREM
ncbi:thioredoxin family protein [Telluribacter sp.]|jgi:peroxiredoxin|uniref:thioredoxin family protein n=1 Tax=Telluribacter sp. TaxID=1978767 RepID=UPI002E15DB09|nr:thioredoxin family protein [Telluribacter sp.]